MQTKVSYKTEKKRGRPAKIQLKRPTEEDMKKTSKFINIHMNIQINNRGDFVLIKDSQVHVNT